MTNSFAKVSTNIGVNNLYGADENDYLDFGLSKYKHKSRDGSND